MIPLRRRASKYYAVSTVIDGIRFASKREARRYRQLELLQKAGEISGLCLQPRFPISVNGEHVCEYRADFSYKDKSGEVVVEDVKGVKTPVYRLKKRLVRALYGVEIKET